MQYKTIVMELLEQHPQVHETLKQERKLLAMTESLARELKTTHEQILGELLGQQPSQNQSGPYSGTSLQAMEMAVAELQERLKTLSGGENDDTLNLDQIMEQVIRHSPRA